MDVQVSLSPHTFLFEQVCMCVVGGVVETIWPRDDDGVNVVQLVMTGVIVLDLEIFWWWMMDMVGMVFLVVVLVVDDIDYHGEAFACRSWVISS